MIDDVLRELESVGKVDSEGEFTMDRVKAREKMRRFQLADPRAYVLELVQAASLKGATWCTFEIDSRDMVMELDGRPFTAADFDDIYGAAFTRRLDPDVLARRQLALGVNSAMALRPKWIEVESGDGTSGARLRLAPDEEDVYEVIETARVGTRIHVRERFGLGTFSAFFRNMSGKLAEEQLLRAKCGYASLGIGLEGERLDHGLVLEWSTVLDVVTLEQGHTRLVCGLDPDGGPMLLRIVKDGVWITTHEVPGDRFSTGFVAVVQDHALRKDVSQSDIVRDDAYIAMLNVVERGFHMTLAALAERFVAGQAPPWAEDELVRRLEKLMRAGVASGDPDEPTGLVRALRRLPLWRTTLGHDVTLDDVFAEAEQRKRVAYSSKGTFDGLVPSDRSFVLHLRAGPRPSKKSKKTSNSLADARKTILELALGSRLHDATSQLELLSRREHARRAWRARPTAPVLPEGAYLCRRSFESPGVRGELGLTAQPTDRATIALVVEGCLLVEQSLKLPWLGLRMVVEADVFAPSPGYDRIQRTRESYAPLLQAANMISVLYGDLAQVSQATQWRDACAMSFLEALLRGDSLVTALFPLSTKESDAALDAAVEACGGPACFVLDAGLQLGTPHATTGMPLFRTLGSRRYSLLELIERSRRHESIRVIDEPVEDIEADILVLDAEAQARLQPLFARPFEDAADDVRQLVRERSFLARPVAVPQYLPDAWAVAVPVQGDGIKGMLRVEPKGRPAGRSTIDVLHRERQLDVIHLVLAGECRGWVESTTVAPTRDFRYVKDSAALDEARAAVLRAFATACIQIAERCRVTPSADDAAFLREVLALPFPGNAMRAAYDKLRADKGTTLAQAAEIHRKIYAAMHVQRDPAAIEDRVARLSRSKSPLADGTLIPAPKRSHRWALAAVDLLFPAGDEPDDWAARVLRPVDPLGELPLFFHHDGRGLGLAAIRALVEQRKSLLHTDERVDLDLGHRMMALVDAPRLEVLRKLVGRQRMLDGRSIIAQLRRAQELASRAKVDAVELVPGETLVSVGIQATKGRRDIEGEVGLRYDHPGDPSRSPRVRLAVHVERVKIEVVELEQEPAYLLAAANDDRLALGSDQHSVVRDRKLDELAERCRACVPKLVSMVVEQWPQLTSTVQQVAWYHLLDFLVAQSPATLEAWGHAGAVDEAFTRVAGVPGFTGTGGVRWSAMQLVKAHARGGRLDALRGSFSLWGDSPLPSDRPVVCVDPYELAALRSLLPNVELVEAQWSTWQARERNRGAAAVTTGLADDQVLVSQDLVMDGLSGQLAIPVAGHPLTIELCAEGRVVAARALDGVLPCWGSIWGSMVEIDATFSDATLGAPGLLALRIRSLKLYGKLARWLGAHDDHPERHRVASLLADQVIALRRVERWASLPKPAARLLDELREIPLLALANGRRISLRMALQEEPDELGHLDLWDAPAHRLQQMYAALVTTPEPRLEPELEPEPEPKPVVEPTPEVIQAAAVVKPAPAPAPAPAPRLPTPEERFVDALRAELSLVRERNERLLSNEHLDRIHVRPLVGAERGLVARADASGVIVNRAHPVVQQAVERLDFDPVWCSFVASAVYTALNVWLEEISDADERTFHRHLAQLVLGR